jgi:hypothetical protein
MLQFWQFLSCQNACHTAQQILRFRNIVLCWFIMFVNCKNFYKLLLYYRYMFISYIKLVLVSTCIDICLLLWLNLCCYLLVLVMYEDCIVIILKLMCWKKFVKNNVLRKSVKILLGQLIINRFTKKLNEGYVVHLWYLCINT